MIATALYRFQISRLFTFDQAKEALSYIHDLGFDGVYCSPFYQSGSDHGYDITDPNRLDRHLGDFDAFCAACHELGMRIVIDVVPNHMGIAEGKNLWWQDVLKYGPNSRFAHFFDINWQPEKKELHNKVLLPILEKSYGESLSEIKVNKEELIYRSFPLPLAPHTEIPEKITEESLHQLLEKQYYRLAHWKVATQELNYRRFFNIQDLVGICIEKEDVLEAHHKWVFELIEKKQVDGLRIDHPDGLLDPAGYFAALRKRYKVFTVVEKILEKDEELPDWEVEGSVGYEYLNLLNALFVQSDNEEAFSRLYKQIDQHDFASILYDSKIHFAQTYMASELDALTVRLNELSERDWKYRDFTRLDLRAALVATAATFPVYRTYITQTATARDRTLIQEAIQEAQKRTFHLDPQIFAFLENILLNDSFVCRFQQFTAPLMAKGLEDTTFYLYNRFISLNEVGGDPLTFGISVEHFHKRNMQKKEKRPYGLLASSTHDAKRSEDARMRLNVLSEMPDRWERMVKKWFALDGTIDQNTAYYIYQTLLAAWPKGELRREDYPGFLQRMWVVILKSVREAKRYTDWIVPNVEYENRVWDFLERLLKPNSRFLTLLIPFVREIEPFAEKNTLASLALKVGSPGVVDTYQGNETWTYQLVDPDNRTPFVYGERSSKQQFLQTLLRFRRAHAELFLEGEYIPVETTSNAIAFIRRTKKEEVLVVAGRFFATSADMGSIQLVRSYRDLITGKEVFPGEVSISTLLGSAPAVYLIG